MLKLDLKDAYFSISIHKKHRKYLRFPWGNKLYEFQAMGFGLGPGPQIFTKVMKPLVSFLRRLGVRLVIYLDDILVLNQSEVQLLRDLNSLRWLLEHLGFLINWKKSMIIPTQQIEFLGFVINSVNMTISLPIEKIAKIADKCQTLVQKKMASVRKLAEILGYMTSSLQAVAPAPLHYRHLQMSQIRSLLNNQSYQAKVHLNPQCLEELRWWIFHMKDWNGKAIINPGPDVIIHTDASKMG